MKLGGEHGILAALLNRVDPGRVFLVTFCFICFNSLFVQLILLPQFLPQWHAGNGLLIGQDSIYFNKLAVELAQNVRLEGWSVWELRPELQAPAGIAAAIYTLTTISEPWVLIPINAALHALAATLLWKILFAISESRWISTLATLPFIFFPSAMQWYSQMAKDSWSIAGSFLVLSGWLILIRPADSSLASQAAKSFVYIASGVLLSWITRPYQLQLLAGASLAVFPFFLSLWLRSNKTWNSTSKSNILTRSLTAIFLFTSLVWFSRSTYSMTYEQLLGSGSSSTSSTYLTWSDTEWLPDPLDGLFHSLAATRYGYTTTSPEAKTNIDTDVVFLEASDVIHYIPRATAIMFLTPFPNTWFDESSLAPNQVMRSIAAVEMLFSYLCLSGLPLAIWLWRWRAEFWTILLFCYLLMMPQALVVANIGTLYRFRYGSFMTLAAIGLLAVVRYCVARRNCYNGSVGDQPDKE